MYLSLEMQGPYHLKEFFFSLCSTSILACAVIPQYSKGTGSRTHQGYQNLQLLKPSVSTDAEPIDTEGRLYFFIFICISIHLLCSRINLYLSPLRLYFTSFILSSILYFSLPHVQVSPILQNVSLTSSCLHSSFFL